jgi:hypothetical protein
VATTLGKTYSVRKLSTRVDKLAPDRSPTGRRSRGWTRWPPGRFPPPTANLPGRSDRDPADKRACVRCQLALVPMTGKPQAGACRLVRDDECKALLGVSCPVPTDCHYSSRTANGPFGLGPSGNRVVAF